MARDRYTIRFAALATVALATVLALTGCGGGSAPSHQARPSMTCQQQANRVQALLTKAIKDGVAGKDLAKEADVTAAKAFWDSMHKRHCPASSYAQLSRFLNELPG